ncbi:DUF512 domain-containing protein [Thermincola ferriacetica]
MVDNDEEQPARRYQPMQKQGALINYVEPDSIAAEAGLEKGDVIRSVNGNPVTDLIDYKFLTTDEFLEIEVLKKSGEEWIIEIDKEFDEDLGLGFETATFDGITSCRNRCVFCFVDQMPAGMRKSLYIKDDDYRLSFLQGNFVTLTNLTAEAMQRIINMRLSPLYISVHTTNPDLRVKMLRNKKAARIMEQLQQLADAGIEMHTQVVLCPGINDGAELDRTLDDLTGLWPAVQSIAIVPVGLTGHRAGLTELRTVTPEEARDLINRINSRQQELRRKTGKTMVYLSDEFYLKAEIPIPPSEHYDDFAQLENGVGMVRLLYEDFAIARKNIPDIINPPRKVILATGVLGEQAIKPMIDELNEVKGLRIDIFTVQNRFFGGAVTVTGLVTGSDIIHAFRERDLSGDLLVIPSVMCKKTEAVFLDDLTPQDLERRLGIKVSLIDISNGLDGFLDVLFNRRERDG